MVGIYKTTVGIFDNALQNIQDGMFVAGANLFNSTFMNLAFTLTVMYIAFLLIFQKIKTEELAYKLIWLVCIFAIVKGILAKESFYFLFIDIINAPSNALLVMVGDVVGSANKDANLENIIETLIISLKLSTGAVFAQGGIFKGSIAPFAYGILLTICGVFTIVALLLFSVFASFLAKLVLSLSPFVIVFLLWGKTQYIFFNWLKLYVSLSLYPAMTILLGLVTYQVAEYMKKTATALPTGYVNEVISIMIALILIALAIFKIPNLINQVIGSSNEGSSLSGGLGTISAGAAMIGGFAKFTGMKLAAKGASAVASKGLDGAKDTWLNPKHDIVSGNKIK